jgi:hypothetical protein
MPGPPLQLGLCLQLSADRSSARELSDFSRKRRRIEEALRFTTLGVLNEHPSKRLLVHAQLVASELEQQNQHHVLRTGHAEHGLLEFLDHGRQVWLTCVVGIACCARLPHHWRRCSLWGLLLVLWWLVLRLLLLRRLVLRVLLLGRLVRRRRHHASWRGHPWTRHRRRCTVCRRRRVATVRWRRRSGLGHLRMRLHWRRRRRVRRWHLWGRLLLVRRLRVEGLRLAGVLGRSNRKRLRSRSLRLAHLRRGCHWGRRLVLRWLLLRLLLLGRLLILRRLVVHDGLAILSCSVFGLQPCHEGLDLNIVGGADECLFFCALVWEEAKTKSQAVSDCAAECSQSGGITRTVIWSDQVGCHEAFYFLWS